MPPKLIFGTATFGMDGSSFADAASVRQLLTKLQALNISHLDTAARYPPLNPGRSEELIGGAIDMGKDLGFEVDTKLYTDTKTDGGGDLERERMERSVEESLRRLGRRGVTVLYAHRADPATPLEEQIRNFNEEIKLGRCKAWGVSNMLPAVLEEMLHICEEKGLQKPSCYQGDYNLITRGMETKLLPILRAHSMTFYGFRPLAAGFLTGKLTNNQTTGTRFDPSNPLSTPMKSLYGADELHVGMKKFVVAVKEHGLSPAEVAIRWLAHHSALREDDGIILGASRVEQIVETVGFVGKGLLGKELLGAAEELWEVVRGVRGDVI